jgi:site-specific DNA-methyltransferase (adenine-specific)
VKPYYQDETLTVYNADALDVLRGMAECSVDAVVCDPPYGLEFMGKEWDSPGRMPGAMTRMFDRDGRTGGKSEGYRQMQGQMRNFQAWCETWAAECLRVLKPGGYLLAFGGTRTWHRLACAVEDAGFELRDTIAWLYGSGFPKSLDVGKAIDKAARGFPQGTADPTSPNHGKYRTTTTEGKRWEGDSGQGYGAGGSRFLADGMANGSATARVAPGDAETVADVERWQGWGTALKPAFEPIACARKPMPGTVAQNVLMWGTGALNVDGCRVEGVVRQVTQGLSRDPSSWEPRSERRLSNPDPAGRWPPNVLLDEAAAEELDQQSGVTRSAVREPTGRDTRGIPNAGTPVTRFHDTESRGVADSGGASRYFPVFKYQAKAPAKERPSYVDVNGKRVAHSTVKPLTLIRGLARLVTPPGGLVLDPFAGSGTTAEACILEGFRCVTMEREAEYMPLIQQRIDRQRFRGAHRETTTATVNPVRDDIPTIFDLLDQDGAA